MKKITGIIIILLLTKSIAKADVIYSPYTEIGIVMSFEGIVSYELPVLKNNTIDFWGGFGVVSALGTLKDPAFGTEMAFELRHYFKDDLFEKINIGFYAGFAYMKYPEFYGGHVTGRENSVGFVPGLKLTYKKKINSWLVGEPYVGVSTPWYGDDFGDLLSEISDSDPGLIFTFGFRLGINKIRNKD